ncbi:hypothetical protein R5R35_008529 [Gryllus longicercus]|uniref:Mitochondrial carnitine/acylcarnitine carrier protein n=1 Tax=Gryllus longicercus TaxID=2509291 RepID=A0AAN9VJD4_9ORTH
MPEDINLMRYFISGAFGGVCSVTVGHPFDTIKVRLQTMPKVQPGEQPLYTGTVDCVKKTVATEGIRGLFKGMGARIGVVVPIFAIRFFSFGFAKKSMAGSTDHELTPLQLFAAGAFAGIFTTIAMAPGERIKCLLQVQGMRKGPPIYSGPSDVVKKLYKSGGIRSVYKGAGATLLRDTPATGMFLMTYEWLKRTASRKNGPDTPRGMEFTSTLVAGGLAGFGYWFVALPADVVKSRVQSSDMGLYSKGVRDALPELLREEGVRGLYKGLTVVLLRAFPANAACFIGYECMMKVPRGLVPDI